MRRGILKSDLRIYFACYPVYNSYTIRLAMKKKFFKKFSKQFSKSLWRHAGIRPFMKSDMLLTVSIIVLAVIALVLGYVLWRQARPAVAPALSTEILLESTSPGASNTQFDVLNPPSPDASPDEHARFFEEVQRLAREADFVDISDCTPNPQVLQVKYGSTITFRNQDTAEHTITHNPQYQFVIPPGGTKEVAADFGRGPGLYGYGCESSSGAIGMILITPLE